MAFLWVQRLWYRGQLHRASTESYLGITLKVPPGVLRPVLMRTGALLADLVEEFVPMDAPTRVFDLGCGSGIGAILAARRGARVVAVDVNPHAVEAAINNAARNGMSGRVEVRQGDLFDPVGEDRFDVVLFNPPYFDGEPRNWAESAWRASGLRERFVAQRRDHLTTRGYVLLVLSSHGESELWLKDLAASGFSIERLLRRTFPEEALEGFRVCPNA